MPSLAQGYGRGLLLGLQLEEVKRQKQRDELSDEFLRERLEDMRFQRKTLMSQLKREEEERREAGLEKEQKGWRMAETGVGLRDLLLGAGITMPQAELAETEYYETEKIPSYAAEWLTPPETKAERVTPSWQADRALFSKTPSQMTVEEYRIALSKGREWDPKKGAWIPTGKILGINLFDRALGAGGIPPEGEIPPEGKEGGIEIDPAIINYINDEATDRAEAEGFLYNMGYTNPKDISNILAKSKFGK